MKKFILIGILLLALFLRFYKLDNYPAINADEASNAYDAFSLIETGRDQHGRSWPLSFQSFNDFKPGLYVYLSIPLIKIFGLNEWTARIPGALVGVLSVFVLYLLVKELFKKENLALLSAFLLTISPWHIHFSRGGWEVNLGTFLILIALVFLFRSFEAGKKYKNRNLAVSAVFFALSFYAYHASRVIVPLIGISVAFIYWKKIVTDIKPFLVFVAVGILLSVPLIFDLLSPGALSRAAGVGLFADKGQLSRINEQRGEHLYIDSIVTKLSHNKGVNYGLQFLDNWATHYNGEFLFMSGDSIERNKVPETGEMYLVDMVFLLAGLIYLIKSIANKLTDNGPSKFILAWLLVAPVASALTFQSPNALRSQNMVIPLIIISSLGLMSLWRWFGEQNNKSFGKVLGVLTIILIAWNFGRYQEMYWKYMSGIYPYSSQYGVKELVGYLNSSDKSYEDVFVTTRYDQPYILFLFYSKTSPKDFQFKHTLTSRDEYGFSTVPSFGKYNFGPIDFVSVQNNYPNSLIVGTQEEIPQTSNIIKRIYGTNGYEYFDIVSN
jgi:4-amino-4-deoxy-L-arabinose transferase-like glycosyltransferase